jgi:hypothetical protein
MTDTLDHLIDHGVANWLVEAMRRLARDDEPALDAFLVTVGETSRLADTQAKCACRFVARDGNRRPRVEPLARHLADQVVDYCIPRSRILEVRDHFARTGRTDKVLGLQREATSLFTHLTTSGEGGEMLLYLLLEVGLGIPQLLCKMPLKTNPNVHYHGVDGVHGTATNDGGLALYWCESKLYTDAAAAIRDCFDSLAPFLLDDGGGSASRDLMLVRDHLDTGDAQLTAALQNFVTEDHPDSTRLEIRGACMVGFSVENYPDPLEPTGGAVVADVRTALDGWHDKIVKRIGKHKLEKFELEVFCVPFPDVEVFRSTLRTRLGLS